MSVTSMRNNALNSITARATSGEVSTLVTSAALAASGAFTASSVIDVHEARRINLYIKYTPHASGTGNYPQILALVSPATAEPATTADSWYAPQINDGVVTATTLTGSFPTDVDATVDPEWGSVTVRPLVLRTEAINNATDEIRIKVPIDVESDRWLFLLYAEEGDTTNVGTLAIDYVMSC